MLLLSRQSLPRAFLLLAASRVLLGCANDIPDSSSVTSDGPDSQPALDSCPAVPEDPAKPAFSYDRHDLQKGPSQWGRLRARDGSVAYPACADTTNQQSPIALPSPDKPWASGGMHLDARSLSYSHETNVTSLLNNGHTWLAAVDPNPPNTLTYEGDSFALQQFHVHTPSEHTLGGKSFPMEMHLVHRGGHSAYAVVIAVMFEESAENNPELAKFWDLFAACPQTTATPENDLTVDVASFLPTNTAHFEYDGSLTTPPCTTVVHWFVMTEPMHASTAQIQAFMDTFGQSNRTAQPVRDEKLVTYEAPEK